VGLSTRLRDGGRPTTAARGRGGGGEGEGQQWESTVAPETAHKRENRKPLVPRALASTGA
jgi:hypothetical protein